MSIAMVIAGIDEVGRGSWFGPVFAGAVILSKPAARALHEAGLTDSKTLSHPSRARLVPLIKDRANTWSLGQASAREIDAIGIRPATEKAMLRALQHISDPAPDLLLVDGCLPLRTWSGLQRTLVRGDSRCVAIAAASVLAKETRDALVRRLAKRFTGYGLERHVGYGTLQHREALLRLGPTVLHRHSFLQRVLTG